MSSSDETIKRVINFSSNDVQDQIVLYELKYCETVILSEIIHEEASQIVGEVITELTEYYLKNKYSFACVNMSLILNIEYHL